MLAEQQHATATDGSPGRRCGAAAEETRHPRHRSGGVVSWPSGVASGGQAEAQLSGGGFMSVHACKLTLRLPLLHALVQAKSFELQ